MILICNRVATRDSTPLASRSSESSYLSENEFNVYRNRARIIIRIIIAI